MSNLERTTQWMETHAGKQLYLPVTADMLDIMDIAHSLSMQCRFAGHTLRFYSVAEHCVNVADWVLEQSGDERHALGALLHDASEAYLVDIPKPIKPYLANYKELETQIEGVVAAKYGVDYPWSVLIKEADCRILLDERDQLFNYSGHDWELPVSSPLGIKIHAHPPHVAKGLFMQRFLAWSKNT